MRGILRDLCNYEYFMTQKNYYQYIPLSYNINAHWLVTKNIRFS